MLFVFAFSAALRELELEIEKNPHIHAGLLEMVVPLSSRLSVGFWS